MEGLWIAVFAVIILVSVCLHEAGHMLTAKAFGMKVTRYFVGFGPTLWSFRRGETEYGVKAIPLGGFVKIVGMTPQDDDVDPEDEPRAMWRYPVWKRTIVMSAGSITHFILGFVLFWIVLAYIGMPNPKIASLEDNVYAAPAYVNVTDCAVVSATAVTCGTGDPKGPAKTAGLKDNDLITSVDGTKVSNYGDLVTAIRSHAPGAIVGIGYERDGKAAVTTVTLAEVQRPPLNDPKGTVGPASALGVAWTPPPSLPTTVKYGAVGAIGHAGSTFGGTFKEIGSAIKSLPGKVPGLISALSGKPRDPNGPISVVGASEIGGQVASLGLWNLYFLIAASLNLFVGVFNLLPLLPLDGGHIAIAWYEKVRSWLARRRNRPDPGRVDYMRLMPLTYAVIVVFGGFSLLTILADVINPINIVGK